MCPETYQQKALSPDELLRVGGNLSSDESIAEEGGNLEIPPEIKIQMLGQSYQIAILENERAVDRKIAMTMGLSVALLTTVIGAFWSTYLLPDINNTLRASYAIFAISLTIVLAILIPLLYICFIPRWSKAGQETLDEFFDPRFASAAGMPLEEWKIFKSKLIEKIIEEPIPTESQEQSSEASDDIEKK